MSESQHATALQGCASPGARSESREQRVEARAALIYAWSLREVGREPETDHISDEDGSIWWLDCPTKAQAIREFRTEMGLDRKDVACRREWMAIDLEAIEELARAMAEEDIAEEGEEQVPLDDDVVAYTWEDGFMYSPCKRTADGARRYWRVEYAPAPAAALDGSDQ